MSTHKSILPHVALVYIQCFVSLYCYYNRVVKETGKLYAAIVELLSKKEKHCWVALRAKAEIQKLLERWRGAGKPTTYEAIVNKMHYCW